MKRLPKLSIAVASSCRLIVAARATVGMGADQPHFQPLLVDAQRRADVKVVVADAGYDSEANHCIAQEGMGIRAIIPPDTGRPTDKPPSTPYRREMRERFDSGADKGTCGQRWQVETVNSMIKRNLGSALRAKSAGRRSMELLLRCVTASDERTGEATALRYVRPKKTPNYLAARIHTDALNGIIPCMNADRLNDLVSVLDKMGSKPALFELASALENAQLSYADIANHVHLNHQNYNRATVALRDHYELLVMTWLPGQASVAHDHGPSICAMLTVQGQAVEGNYRVAPDGYVDLEYETVYKTGEITAGQDAAVHTISNTNEDVLVTVHIYSPPLRDFRRFTVRPAVTDHAAPPNDAESSTIAIVGGGFSGSITAAQILRQAKAAQSPIRVVLLEQRGSIGEGLAYSSREECHLLNVPAGRMSAWPDQPNDFLRWANAHHGSVSADDFVPRQWYGEYIRQTVLKTAADAGDDVQLSVVFDEVRRIARHPGGGWMLSLARGTSVRAGAVVLAIGHRSPNDPLGRKWTGPRTRFISDPWKPFAMNAVAPDDSVVILGSGLTAVDAVMSLACRGHRGQITLISRRGLLPQPHLPGHGTPVDLNVMVMELTNQPVRALELLRNLREQAALATADGKPWQSVIDGLRPHIALLWSKMPGPERRRFLNHLRGFWEVHRHRMPVPVAEKFSSLTKAGTVRILPGRVESVAADADQLRLCVRNRTDGSRSEIAAGWIVNATGPSPSNSAAANPAIGSLLIQGLVSVDEMNLGVQTTPDGNAIAGDGQAVADLFVVGTLRKPDLWESTAVPELRTQAANAARQIVLGLVSNPA